MWRGYRIRACSIIPPVSDPPRRNSDTLRNRDLMGVRGIFDNAPAGVGESVAFCGNPLTRIGCAGLRRGRVYGSIGAV